jgi:hypothetical protein
MFTGEEEHTTAQWCSFNFIDGIPGQYEQSHVILRISLFTLFFLLKRHTNIDDDKIVIHCQSSYPHSFILALQGFKKLSLQHEASKTVPNKTTYLLPRYIFS